MLRHRENDHLFRVPWARRIRTPGDFPISFILKGYLGTLGTEAYLEGTWVTVNLSAVLRRRRLHANPELRAQGLHKSQAFLNEY